MRRLWILCVLALAVLALPVVSFAQDEQPELAWELSDSSYINITDLGFRVYYPVDWIVDTSRAITIATTQEDIDAVIDGDDSTQAAGITIGVRGLPLKALADLGDSPTLDEMVDFGVQAGGTTEKSRTESPIMTRRSISIIGTNPVGRDVIASFWKQGDYLVLATVNVPENVSIDDIAQTWGATIRSIAPLDALDIGEETINDSISGFSVRFPAEWTVNPDEGGKVYEVAEDVGIPFTDQTGSNIGVVDAALTDLGLTEDATLEDLVAATIAGVGLTEEPASEEFVFLGQPAVLVTGEPLEDSPGAGRGFVFLASVVNGRAVLFTLSSPTPEAAEELKPTLIQMLRTMTPLEATE